MTAETAIRTLIDRNRRYVARYDCNAYSRETDDIINALLLMYADRKRDLTDDMLRAMGGRGLHDTLQKLPVEWVRLLVAHLLRGADVDVEAYVERCRLALYNIENYRRELRLLRQIGQMGLPPDIADRLLAMQVQVLADGYGHSFLIDDQQAVEIYTNKWTTFLDNILQ